MRSRQAGITLLEIMIVLAILALVMGLVIGPKLFAHYTEAQRRVARIAVHKLADQDYPVWTLAHPAQACPAGAVELTGSSDAAADPWGTAYKLHCGATAPPVAGLAFAASSFGQDRREATPDDIQSWGAGE
jgi:prepilin-type N-terminal cleavage/methylation domain-containing protein